VNAALGEKIILLYLECSDDCSKEIAMPFYFSKPRFDYLWRQKVKIDPLN